jgi:hypothetical protein
MPRLQLPGRQDASQLHETSVRLSAGRPQRRARPSGNARKYLALPDRLTNLLNNLELQTADSIQPAKTGFSLGIACVYATLSPRGLNWRERRGFSGAEAR